MPYDRKQVVLAYIVVTVHIIEIEGNLLKRDDVRVVVHGITVVLDNDVIL